MTNVADILVVGEKCFEDELYSTASLTGLVLLQPSFTWALRVPGKPVILSMLSGTCRISLTLICFRRVWKQVHAACIEKSEF